MNELEQLCKAAQQAREQGDVIRAIDLTTKESLALGRTGKRELALARATWAMAAAHDPANRQILQSDKAAWQVTMAFLIWLSSSRRAAKVPIEAQLDVLAQLERFLVSVGRGHWRSGPLAELASIKNNIGAHDEAIALYREAIELKVRDPRTPGVTLMAMRRSLGYSLSSAGRLDEAVELLEQVLGDPDCRDLDRLAAQAHLTHAYLELKDAATAARYADAAVETAEAQDDPQRLAAYGAAVEAWLAAGRREDARRAATRMLELAANLGGHGPMCSACLDNFDVAFACGELDDAARWLERVEQHLLEMERYKPAPGHREYYDARVLRLAEARARSE